MFSWSNRNFDSKTDSLVLARENETLVLETALRGQYERWDTKSIAGIATDLQLFHKVVRNAFRVPEGPIVQHRKIWLPPCF